MKAPLEQRHGIPTGQPPQLEGPRAPGTRAARPCEWTHQSPGPLAAVWAGRGDGEGDLVPGPPCLVSLLPKGVALAGGEAGSLPHTQGDNGLLRRKRVLVQAAGAFWLSARPRTRWPPDHGERPHSGGPGRGFWSSGGSDGRAPGANSETAGAASFCQLVRMALPPWTHEWPGGSGGPGLQNHGGTPGGGPGGQCRSLPAG